MVKFINNKELTKDESNVPNDQLDAITKLLSGMKSPTVLPLADEGCCSER